MKRSLQSALSLLGPALLLGGFAFFASRRAPAKIPADSNDFGPFQFQFGGLESQKLTPNNVSDGYDHHFALVFQRSGAKPKWWGQHINSRSGTDAKNWKFWLERDGKKTPFAPAKTQLWTTNWDDEKKRYFNEFLLQSGEIPDAAALKARAPLQVTVAAGPKLSAPMPVEITLKKAGEKWRAPVVSHDCGMTIRKIEIQKPKGGQTLALITVLKAPDLKDDNSSLYSAQILDAQGKYVPNMIGFSFGGPSKVASGRLNNNIRIFELQWPAANLKNAPQRDLRVSATYSMDNRWPLEIAFWVKKNGKAVFGVVPAFIHPSASDK